MIKSNKYLVVILLVLIIIAGISTVVAESQDNSLAVSSSDGEGSFNTEDSFSDGDGSFTSDDNPTENINGGSDDVEDDENQSSVIWVGKHATSHPIALLFIALISSGMIGEGMYKFR